MWQPSQQDVANRDTLNALEREGRSPYALFFPGGIRGCLGCLPWVIVLCVLAVIAGTIIGHHRNHHGNAQPSPKGQVNYQVVTLTNGRFYGLTEGGDLNPVDGPGYFLRMTDSALSFADNVHVIAAPISATGLTDPCVGLALSTHSGPRALAWAKLEPSTQLCAQPQGSSPVAYNYVVTIDGFGGGQQLNVRVTTWDRSAS